MPLAGEVVPELVADAVDPPGVVVGFAVAGSPGRTKSTVSEPVPAFCCTCASATNSPDRPHGIVPTCPVVAAGVPAPSGAVVPKGVATLTFPRKRSTTLPVPVADGRATSRPTSWTSWPVAPVTSIARTEPFSATHASTLTRTGAVEPGVEGVGVTSPVPWKAAQPPIVVMSRNPVLSAAPGTEEVRGATDVGTVTPGNPVTPVHAARGSTRAEL